LPSGDWVSIRDEVERSRSGTRLYRPEEVIQLPLARSAPPSIDVRAEKAGSAACRLIQEEGISDVVLLNFASAKNPGGGFLGGAKAQEEDLVRCSALYGCLAMAPDYYRANRMHPSFLYTDHMIHSPAVPFFRDEHMELLARPFVASVITASAPNAGEVLRRDPQAGPAIRAVLRSRALRVLKVAAQHGHQALVLGAWGCGVFRNDPHVCAEAFALALNALPGLFIRVTFAIHEPGGDGPNLRAFLARFDG
jgi:uncharacterized protein (TIGR02452 family)